MVVPARLAIASKIGVRQMIELMIWQQYESRQSRLMLYIMVASTKRGLK